jgi:hypothetical protein
MNLKGLHFADFAVIQESVTVELTKIIKRNFRQLLRNCTTAQKLVYMLVELILNKKKYVYSSRVFDLKKKSVLKLLDCTVYVRAL